MCTFSLGIDDPVTKDSAGSDKKYYQGLAQEMFLILDTPVGRTYHCFDCQLT